MSGRAGSQRRTGAYPLKMSSASQRAGRNGLPADRCQAREHRQGNASAGALRQVDAPGGVEHAQSLGLLGEFCAGNPILAGDQDVSAGVAQVCGALRISARAVEHLARRQEELHRRGAGQQPRSARLGGQDDPGIRGDGFDQEADIVGEIHPTGKVGAAPQTGLPDRLPDCQQVGTGRADQAERLK